MYKKFSITCLAGVMTVGIALSTASAGVVTEIMLGDFVNPTVLDFNTAPLGNISGTDPVFTDFGISQASATGTGFSDEFNVRANSSRALWFDAGGLVIVDPGATDLANFQTFTFEFAQLQFSFGFGTHDQANAVLDITFFDGITNVGFISIVTSTTTADLASHYFLSSDAFDSVFINHTSGGGFGIDDLTLETQIPEPSTLAIFAFGLAGLGFFMRRRRVV